MAPIVRVETASARIPPFSFPAARHQPEPSEMAPYLTSTPTVAHGPSLTSDRLRNNTYRPFTGFSHFTSLASFVPSTHGIHECHFLNKCDKH
jgi:hypothetical protein